MDGRAVAGFFVAGVATAACYPKPVVSRLEVPGGARVAMGSAAQVTVRTLATDLSTQNVGLGSRTRIVVGLEVRSLLTSAAVFDVAGARLVLRESDGRPCCVMLPNDAGRGEAPTEIPFRRVPPSPIRFDGGETAAIWIAFSAAPLDDSARRRGALLVLPFSGETIEVEVVRQGEVIPEPFPGYAALRAGLYTVNGRRQAGTTNVYGHSFGILWHSFPAPGRRGGYRLGAPRVPCPGGQNRPRVLPLGLIQRRHRWRARGLLGGGVPGYPRG